MNKTNEALRSDVLDELIFDPAVNEADIVIEAMNGTITLSGRVGSYPERWAAISDAWRVSGVTGVNAEGLSVVPAQVRQDEDIRAAAQSALDWSVTVPPGVTASVQGGYVTLHGEVDWQYQRRAAEDAVRDLSGVKDVFDDITLRPRPSVDDVQSRIQSALRRNATLDAAGITVTLSGGTVTLSGTVKSWAERDEAERAAWAASGVLNVRDNITVSY